MEYKNVNVELPVELWRKVGVASSFEGKQKKEWVKEVLQAATENVIKRIH